MRQGHCTPLRACLEYLSCLCAALAGTGAPAAVGLSRSASGTQAPSAGTSRAEQCSGHRPCGFVSTCRFPPQCEPTGPGAFAAQTRPGQQHPPPPPSRIGASVVIDGRDTPSSSGLSGGGCCTAWSPPPMPYHRMLFLHGGLQLDRVAW